LPPTSVRTIARFKCLSTEGAAERAFGIGLRCTLVFLSVFLAPAPAVAQLGSPDGCSRTSFLKVQNTSFWWAPSRVPAFFYTARLAIDADGAFRAYHPTDRLGLDSLHHAGHPGNWWALVTDSGKPSGHPLVQRKSDPAPGFYVSTTALYDPRNPNPRDPHRYVDAASIPYVVVHPAVLRHTHLGDFATVVNLQNGKVAAAIVADQSSPDLPVGEGSIALAKRLGIASDPRHGGKEEPVIGYVIYPGSGNGRPRSLREIVFNSNRLFKSFGGRPTLSACLAPPL
jgi:hypothetical protein